MISQVTPNLVDAVWAQIEPMVESGLSHGQGDETSSEHMRECVIRGDMQMWVVHEDETILAGLIFSVVDNLNGRKVWVEMLAGDDMNAWIDELQERLAECRDWLGATCIEASCRPGMAKYLKGRGWDQKAVVMSLESDNG